jgi:hypothetical protein
LDCGLRWMSGGLALAGLIWAACAAPAASAAPVPPEAELADLGLTTFHFERHVLTALDVEVAAARGARRVEDSWTHSYRVVAPSRLELGRGNGGEGDIRSGLLLHEGGPVLRLPDAELSLEGFELRVVEPPFVFDLVDRAGLRWFLLDYLHLMRAPQEPVHRLRNMDLSIAPELAKRLGRPELTGAYAGYLEVELSSALVSSEWEGAAAASRGLAAASEASAGVACVADFDPALEVDVALTLLGEPSHFPGPDAAGRVALGFDAQLSNVGTADIPWFRSIAPDGVSGSLEVGPHPYLVLHFYRLADGVLTQLGLSDVKHAFFSTNVDCSCAPGQVLFVGCADVYGTGTNTRQEFFAPRGEVDAFSGAWQRVGSHFDGDPADDFRDHGKDHHPDSFEHRLVVMDSELSTAGAEYFIEGWYLAAGDVNIFNGMGHRKVSPILSGDIWTFPLVPGGLEGGSMLDVVVGPSAGDGGRSNELIDTGRGHLQLVATTRPGSSGRVHYEYALMNFDFEGEISSFSVPLAAELDLAGVGFSGFGPGSSPSWIANREAEALVWTAPEGAALAWGSLVSFRFEADAEPVGSDALAGALEMGPGEGFAIPMRGPTPVPEPAAGLLGAAALLGLTALRRAGITPGSRWP